MSAVIWWGYPQTESATLFVRPDSDGILTAVCRGNTYSAGLVSLSAGFDRVGKITITGLPTNSRSDVSIYLDGTLIDTASARTAPSTGEADFRVIVLSCQYSKFPWVWDGVIDKIDPVLVVYCGDVPYCEQPDSDSTGSTGNTLTGWEETVQGISSVAKTDSARQSCIWAHHRLFRRKLANTCKRYPSLWIKSDHDGYPANNWDRTVATGNAYNATLFADLAEVDDFHSKVDTWHRPYYQGNPPNSSTGRDVTRPIDDQLYYSLGLGNLRVFVTDHYTYQSRGDDVVRYQLGSTQEQWLLDEAKNCTEPLKLWACSPGAPWLSGAIDEGNRIFDVIGNPAKHSWNAPGGWVNFHGDIHVPFAQYDDYVAGHGRTLLRVNSSPCGTGQNLSWNPAGVGQNTIYSAIPATGDKRGFYWTIGVADINAAGKYLDCHLIDEVGNKRFSRRIFSGSNVAFPV